MSLVASHLDFCKDGKLYDTKILRYAQSTLDSHCYEHAIIWKLYSKWKHKLSNLAWPILDRAIWLIYRTSEWWLGKIGTFPSELLKTISNGICTYLLYTLRIFSCEVIGEHYGFTCLFIWSHWCFGQNPILVFLEFVLTVFQTHTLTWMANTRANILGNNEFGFSWCFS